jgi:iron complex outermembrane receptor protein
MKYITAVILSLTLQQAFSQAAVGQSDTLQTVNLQYYELSLIFPYSVYRINNSLYENTGNLSEVLFKNSPFQIREYGRGMMSGISIRGSAPSHVQVLWHGIPLNSPLNGQTDLNTVSGALFQNISIIKGGTSVMFGSGAMAGSLIIKNPLNFTGKLDGAIIYSGGQFGNINPVGTFFISNKKHALKIGLYYRDDKNLYTIEKKNYTNRNAEIFKNDYTLDYAFRHKNHTIDFHIYNSYTDRNLPGTLTTVSHAKLVDFNYRYALNYHYHKGDFVFNVNTARLSEHYRYYHDKTQGISGEGSAFTYVVKSGITYFTDYDIIFFGEAGIQKVSGKTKNFNEQSLWKNHLLSGLRFFYNSHRLTAGLRKNIFGGYRLPLADFVQWKWRISKKYTIQLGTSKNYRIPTFNDLFWEPGGNPGLHPETAREWEFTQILSGKKLLIQLDIFHKHTKNLIKWRPTDNGFWSPVNIESVTAKGVELSALNNITVNHLKFHIKSGIQYHSVINDATGKQLVYTPEITGFINTSAKYKSISVHYGFRYQDHYYTDPQHHSIVYGHWLHNIGLEYRFENLFAGIEINNLFNQYYVLMPSRPMPGREITWKIKYLINKK